MTKNSMRQTAQKIRTKHGLNRRVFLKASAITAAVGGVAGLSSKLFFGKGAPAKGATLDIWNLPAFTPASGTYKPDSTWKSIAQQYRFPDWYRDAKYGIWAHWSPQSVPEYGDWYALHMYQQGTADYNYHLAHYGHPSKFGYKDITHLFTGSQWDPNALLKLYVQQGGAKYFMALANHHDNYDNWDSTYQPWNSQTVGRKSSIIGEWEAATRAQGIPFGVTYHACPGPSWGYFLPARYNHDKTGTYAGVPYDGVTTAAQGAGKWWNGLDPQDLNGLVHTGPGYHPKDTDPFVRQFYWRVDDLINKHKPDILYFDDSVNPTAPTGTAVDWSITNQSYVIAANYYNKSLQWHNGSMQVVLNIKNLPGQALPALVQDWEKTIATTIQDYPWQAENSLGPWHYYAPAPITMSSATVVHNLVNAVSKNGTYLINVPQHGDGHLDQQAINVVTSIGNWLKTNGEAIYGTRPFAVFGENNIYYTRKGAAIYAIALTWPGSSLTLTNLPKGSPYLGNVTKVELLGQSGTLSFTQSTSSLVIQIPPRQSASEAYVFKVTQDKVLVNNDDAGVTYSGLGWSHQANRGLGDSNNNIHATTNNGDAVSCTFTGTGIQYITETYSDEGNVAVYIDGTLKQTVSASSSSRKAQVVLYENLTLSAGNQHTIKLVKMSGSLMLIDAFKIIGGTVVTGGTTGGTPTPTPTPGATPTSTPTPTPTGYVKIVNRNSGKLLDVAGSSTTTGALIQQWQDATPSTSSSEWQLVSVAGGYVKIVNRNSGLVVDVTKRLTADGTPIEQWTDNGGTNQQWQVVTVSGGYVKIVSRASGKVLNVSGASTANGGNVTLAGDTGSNNQQWQVVGV